MEIYSQTSNRIQINGNNVRTTNIGRFYWSINRECVSIIWIASIVLHIISNQLWACYFHPPRIFIHFDRRLCVVCQTFNFILVWNVGILINKGNLIFCHRFVFSWYFFAPIQSRDIFFVCFWACGRPHHSEIDLFSLVDCLPKQTHQESETMKIPPKHKPQSNLTN